MEEGRSGSCSGGRDATAGSGLVVGEDYRMVQNIQDMGYERAR